jgi:putative membrane protein
MTAALRTLVLAAWAAFFAFLWASGEGERYLGPRTQWVIPFGALALGATALAQGVLAATRRGHKEPSRGEVAGSLVLALPMLALLVVPTPELGAQAASKKRASSAVLVAQLPAARSTAAGGETRRASFVDVAVAALSPKEGATLGLREGARVRVQGLAIHDSDVSGTFGLARFFVSCCAADAVPVVVPVDPGRLGRPPQDRWLVVSGALRRRGERLVVAATQLEETRAPSSPYVSASDGGTAAAPPAPQPTKGPPPSGELAGFAGRAANVYERYYAHCKEFTYDALAWPERASNADEAARLFAGPPRPLQPAAYRGCVDGLNAGEARITLKELFRRAAQGGGG